MRFISGLIKRAICLALTNYCGAVFAEGVGVSIYQLAANDAAGKSVSLDTYQGKVALIVNTASKCGFTSQYQGLQEIYESHKDRGLVVLGFPSNDFGGQEPGTNEQIQNFCQLNYSTTFPIFAKSAVKGADKNPIFRALTEQSGQLYQGEIGWNFEKFLIDREGKVRARYTSVTKPNNPELLAKVEELLAES